MIKIRRLPDDYALTHQEGWQATYHSPGTRNSTAFCSDYFFVAGCGHPIMLHVDEKSTYYSTENNIEHCPECDNAGVQVG